MTIAFLDVDYRGEGAQAACVIASSWRDASPSSEHVVDIATVDAYEPGHFYRRELPCLLKVLAELRTEPDVVVVDGYVWLPGDSRPGLGLHLHRALGERIPVVGIAKTAFAGAWDCPAIAPLHRGQSSRPLFVTSVGMALEEAKQHVRDMAGEHRMPLMLAAVDRLARSSVAR